VPSPPRGDPRTALTTTPAPDSATWNVFQNRRCVRCVHGSSWASRDVEARAGGTCETSRGDPAPRTGTYPDVPIFLKHVLTDTGHKHTSSRGSTLPGRRAPVELRNIVRCGWSPLSGRRPWIVRGREVRENGSSWSTSQSTSWSSSSNRNERTTCSVFMRCRAKRVFLVEGNMCSYCRFPSGRNQHEQVYVRSSASARPSYLACLCGIRRSQAATRVAVHDPCE
jgi:hypothetical protein